MYTHEDFVSDVLRNFEFLETEYAMRREPLQVAGAGCWVAFSNAVARVVIEHETAGYCSVSVQNPHHVKKDPLERSEFDLEEIVAVSGGRPPRRMDGRPMSEVLARAAETLRGAGTAALKGDFEALHARQRKTVESIRKSMPEQRTN